jgi:hypothetical protein
MKRRNGSLKDVALHAVCTAMLMAALKAMALPPPVPPHDAVIPPADRQMVVPWPRGAERRAPRGRVFETKSEEREPRRANPHGVDGVDRAKPAVSPVRDERR